MAILPRCYGYTIMVYMITSQESGIMQIIIQPGPYTRARQGKKIGPRAIIIALKFHPYFQSVPDSIAKSVHKV